MRHIKSMDELMKLLAGKDPTDYEKWNQAGKLSPEDLLRRKNHNSKLLEIRREMDILNSKAKLLEAQVEVMHDEFWAHLYKAYGLPKGSYHLMDDGRIMMAPKNDGEAECGCGEEA